MVTPSDGFYYAPDGITPNQFAEDTASTKIKVDFQIANRNQRIACRCLGSVVWLG